MSFNYDQPIGFAPSPSTLKERLRSLFSKTKQLRENEAEREKVLNAAYLLRLIDEPVPDDTPKWTEYRDKEKAEGRDPDPVKFLKETYKEWFDEGVLYPNIVRDYDDPLYKAIAYRTRAEHDSTPTNSVFPIDKQGIQQKRAELLADILQTSPTEAKRFGYNLFNYNRNNNSNHSPPRNGYIW